MRTFFDGESLIPGTHRRERERHLSWGTGRERDNCHGDRKRERQLSWGQEERETDLSWEQVEREKNTCYGGHERDKQENLHLHQ